MSQVDEYTRIKEALLKEFKHETEKLIRDHECELVSAVRKCEEAYEEKLKRSQEATESVYRELGEMTAMWELKYENILRELTRTRELAANPRHRIRVNGVRGASKEIPFIFPFFAELAPFSEVRECEEAEYFNHSIVSIIPVVIEGARLTDFLGMASPSVTIFWNEDGTGYGMAVQKAPTGFDVKYFWARGGCKHEYETSYRAGQYLEQKCIHCGYIHKQDSSG
jgi:hypothetical protein